MDPPIVTPAPVRSALVRWLHHHDDRLPGFVEGLYVVGSAALGNWRPNSDIDIIAVSAEPATADDVAALRLAHMAITTEMADTDIDGPYLTWDDLAAPPRAVVRPWTLHREFHHNPDCFELNPAVWLTLADHGLAIRGPTPSAFDVHRDDRALRSFVKENTVGYWRPISDAIEGALADPRRVEFSADMTAWCVLGLARMLYTARTGRIASKSGAGRWAIGELPAHRPLIERALQIRKTGNASPDDRATAEATAHFMTEVADLVESETG
ncbi:MAG: aminoglycoside adenylyltransferase domain-containing protein [Actinomycetota bacterium]